MVGNIVSNDEALESSVACCASVHAKLCADQVRNVHVGARFTFPTQSGRLLERQHQPGFNEGREDEDNIFLSTGIVDTRPACFKHILRSIKP